MILVIRKSDVRPPGAFPSRITICPLFLCTTSRVHEPQWKAEAEIPESLPANADNRLPVDPLGRVEGGDGIVERRDLADVFQPVVVEVDELLRAEVECRLTVGGASGADDVGAGLAVDEDAPYGRTR
jgi:hypothetical protein